MNLTFYDTYIVLEQTVVDEWTDSNKRFRFMHHQEKTNGASKGLRVSYCSEVLYSAI